MSVKRHTSLLITTCLLALGAWVTPYAAADAVGDAEQALFGQAYAQQPLSERLTRLEALLYGVSNTSLQETERLNKLRQTLESYLAVPPPAEQAATVENAPATPTQPDGTDYPAITALEQKMFQTAYPKDSVASRLQRLEKQVFQQTFTDLPMVDRVDQLTLKVLPNSPVAKEETGVYTLPKKGKELAGSNLAIYAKVNDLEMDIFGRTYGGELMATRLNRLENRRFGQPQKGTIDERMTRLEQSPFQPSPPSAQQLWQPSKPQPQQFSVTPPQVYQPNLPPQAMPEPVVIDPYVGPPVGSPEFINRLPQVLLKALPDARSKLFGSGSIAGLPGSSNPTIIAPNTSTPWPGSPSIQQVPRQAFPSNPSPGWSSPSTVGPIQPYIPNIPQVQPYRYGAPQQITPVPQNTTPSWQLSPLNQGPGTNNMISSIPQSLNLLEVQVFGQSYNNQSLGQRLSNLEQRMFGTTYPYAPVELRLNRLLRQAPFKQG